MATRSEKFGLLTRGGGRRVCRCGLICSIRQGNLPARHFRAAIRVGKHVTSAPTRFPMTGREARDRGDSQTRVSSPHDLRQATTMPRRPRERQIESTVRRCSWAESDPEGSRNSLGPIAGEDSGFGCASAVLIQDQKSSRASRHIRFRIALRSPSDEPRPVLGFRRSENSGGSWA